MTRCRPRSACARSPSQGRALSRAAVRWRACLGIDDGMLSDYERRVLAEFESEFRDAESHPHDAEARRRARSAERAYHRRLAAACIVMVGALILAAALPLPIVGAAILAAVVGPLAGLTFVEALVGPRSKAGAETARDSTTG